MTHTILHVAGTGTDFVYFVMSTGTYFVTSTVLYFAASSKLYFVMSTELYFVASTGMNFVASTGMSFVTSTGMKIVTSTGLHMGSCSILGPIGPRTYQRVRKTDPLYTVNICLSRMEDKKTHRVAASIRRGAPSTMNLCVAGMIGIGAQGSGVGLGADRSGFSRYHDC